MNASTTSFDRGRDAASTIRIGQPVHAVRFNSKRQLHGRITFTPRQLLGKGGAGEVFMCTSDVVPDKLLAVKFVPVTRPSTGERFIQEIKFQAIACGHLHTLYVLGYGYVLRQEEIPTAPMVVVAEEATVAAAAAEEQAKTKDTTELTPLPLQEAITQHGRVMFLVTDVCAGGSLQTLCCPHGLPEPMVIRLVRQLVAALGHVHAKGIVHCDVKPGNLLLRLDRDGRPHAVLTDFGLARKAGAVSSSVKGTPNYLAPEGWSKHCVQHFSQDVWAVGCTAFALLTGLAPFQRSSVKNTKKSICRGAFLYPVKVSPEARAFIAACLVLEPHARATIPQLAAHPWLEEAALRPCAASPKKATESAAAVSEAVSTSL